MEKFITQESVASSGASGVEDAEQSCIQPSSDGATFNAK
jgi:hypothetical protein